MCLSSTVLRRIGGIEVNLHAFYDLPEGRLSQYGFSWRLGGLQS
jgi:hypothetical protein